jgi:DNA-binding NarL/FixJ family response regulator
MAGSYALARWPFGTAVVRGFTWDCVPAYFTRRECEVLDLLLYRQSDQEIAERLCISRRTASTRVASILYKLAARNRREAALVVLTCGLT